MACNVGGIACQEAIESVHEHLCVPSACEHVKLGAAELVRPLFGLLNEQKLFNKCQSSVKSSPQRRVHDSDVTKPHSARIQNLLHLYCDTISISTYADKILIIAVQLSNIFLLHYSNAPHNQFFICVSTDIGSFMLQRTCM